MPTRREPVARKQGAADQFPVARVCGLLRRSDDSITVADISSRYEGFRRLLMKRKKARK